MRGSDKLKSILSTNQETKSMLIKCLFLCNFIFGYVYWHRSVSFSIFAFLSIFEIASVVFIYRICKPQIKNENGIEKLIHVESINSSGMAAFCWDMLFWSMLGKFLIAFNWKWFWVYLGIPVSFFFEFLYNPYKKIKSN